MMCVLQRILTVGIPVALLMTLGACAPVGGAATRTWYVAPGGDDSAAGTEAHPWKTFAKAAAAAQPGDTVYARAGTWHERLIAPTSGTADAPITFSAFPGEAVIIDGTDLAIPDTWGGLVESSGCSHLRFTGFHVQDSVFAGIFVCSGDDLQVTGCFTT